MDYIIFLLVAAAAGSTMAFQGTLNTALGKIVGLIQATTIVHAVGLAVAAVAMFLPVLNKGDITKLGDAPWYTFLGGVLSVVIIYGVQASMSKLGVSNTTTAIIVGQVLTALFIDCCGLFGVEKLPFPWYRGLGLVLLAAGAKLLLMKK